MPLHDWAELSGCEGVHLLWMTELLRDVKGRLPVGFRAYLGSGPALAIGMPSASGKPDVAVRSHSAASEKTRGTANDASPSIPATSGMEPDVELAVATLEPDPALLVERDGRLVAAVELVSPRNKDRLVSRTTYLSRYLGYLIEVHRRPGGFSFADGIAAELQLAHQPPMPPPMAVSYRVGEPAASGGRLLALWRRVLVPGQALPTMPLPLSTSESVAVDLEPTYARAAADAYLA